MRSRAFRPLAALLALVIALAARCGQGQDRAGASPVWQPYRPTNVASLAQAVRGAAGAMDGGEAAPTHFADDPLVQSAQALACPPEMMACPPQAICPPAVGMAQPVFAAPTMVTGAPIMAVPLVAAPVAGDALIGNPRDPAYWQWRVLPESVIWQSYWAGAHEPRMAGVVFNDDDGANLLDVTLGGRASLLRYGTDGPGRPQGLELQIEGAAIPRLNLDENWDLDATDFRFGLPLVYGREKWQAKFSYFHLSAHMGDEFAIREMASPERINFSRDALVLGLSYYPLPAWRLYTEAGWAFHYDESEPWEFQFGVDVAAPGPTGAWGTPFIAVNGHIREEVDFSGNVVAQAGWLWRGNGTRMLRLGFHYFNGKTNQFEFFRQFDEQIGGGLWYDF